MSGFFDHRVTGIDGAPDLLDPLRGQVVPGTAIFVSVRE